MFGGRKILVVEDDVRELGNIVAMVKGLNGKCSTAQRIADAKRLLREESFDFLLTVLHIETKAGSESPDGLNILETATSLQPNILIVSMSNDPRSDTWSAALKAGAQHFVRKPLLREDELEIAFGLARERRSLVSKGKSSLNLKGRWSQFADSYPHGIVVDKGTFR